MLTHNFIALLLVVLFIVYVELTPENTGVYDHMLLGSCFVNSFFSFWELYKYGQRQNRHSDTKNE